MVSESKQTPILRTNPAALLFGNGAILLLLAGMVALQWRAGSLLFGSSPQSDAAKHFASGVMVFDYLRTGHATNPMRFAEDFEVHYPLVAIGQWPPMYYAVQAAYYFVAGPFIDSAQILSVLTAALLALLLFLSLKAHTGIQIALIAAVVFLATPLVQLAAWEIMSDLLTGLFVYLATLAFVRLLDEPGDRRAALAFGAAAVAAVLTKGSAWALGPFFLLAPVFSRRTHFFRGRWFRGTLLLLVLAGSIFYVLAARGGIGYPIRLSHYLSVGIDERWSTLDRVLQFAPVSLIVLGLLGAIVALRARWRGGDQSRWTTLCLASAAWVTAQLLFLIVLPMTPEPRVLLPSLAPLVVLAADFLLWVQVALRRAPLLAAIVPALLAAVVLVESVPNTRYRVDGFREVANAMPYPPDGALILVAANDQRGEEEVIAERLSRGRAHRDVILRGSHELATMNVDSGIDQPIFQTPDAVRAYLLQMPVRFVVLGSPPYQYPFQPLIEAAVTGDPQDFQLIARVPLLVQPSHLNAGELRVYENPAGRYRRPAVIQIRLGSFAGGRILEYRWK
jgi:hypothetical protein